MPGSFVLKDAKFVLLTYPQVPRDEIDGFPELVTDLCGRLECRYVVGKEQHADGGIHFHCFLDFGRKFSSRDTRIFDLGGRHPNIEKVGRTPRKAYDYSIKDGCIVARSEDYTGPETNNSGSDRGGEQGECSAWEHILRSETRDEFFDRLRAGQPRALVCNYTSIAKYADWRYKPVPEIYQHPADFSFDLEGFPVLLDWVSEHLFSTQDRSVLPALRGRRLRPTGRPRPRGLKHIRGVWC